MVPETHGYKLYVVHQQPRQLSVHARDSKKRGCIGDHRSCVGSCRICSGRFLPPNVRNHCVHFKRSMVKAAGFCHEWVRQAGSPPDSFCSCLEGERLIDDSDAQRFVMWHALQLNSLVRMHLHAVTQETGQHTCCNCESLF